MSAMNKYEKKFSDLYSVLQNDSKFRMSLDDFEHGSKCEHSCKQLKCNGNLEYKSKMFEEALISYTDALAKAKFNSELYGIALANRSAVLFEMGRYKDCLNDIRYCLLTDYPDHLRKKLYTRIEKCEKLKDDQQNILESDVDMICAIPEADKNEKLFGATKYIEIAYTQAEGRHIIAADDLEVGTLLFAEPAFAFAPIFVSNGKLVNNKCYKCLKSTTTAIPCKTCSVCRYCNGICRDESWIEGHRFECDGFQSDFWYKVGMGLPALKVLLRGAMNKFETVVDISETWNQFGSGYKYFDSLESHLDKVPEESVQSICDIAAQIVVYLESKTDFFQYLIESDCANVANAEALGLLLIKHMAQLGCNASVIEHWPDNVDTMTKLVERSHPVACAIYPSVSLMNHSCKPNISICFVDDNVIAKTLEPIKRGQQIYNCYGIDYRFSDRQIRQEHLKLLYYFDCNCEICSNPSTEFKNFNSIICPECKMQVISDFTELSVPQCSHCFTSLPTLSTIESNLFLEQYGDILSPTHAMNMTKFGQQISEGLQSQNYVAALKSLEHYMECLRLRFGKGHIEYGIALLIKLHEIIQIMLRTRDGIHRFDEYMEIHSKLELLLKELDFNLSLNCPKTFEFVEELKLKFETF